MRRRSQSTDTSQTTLPSGDGLERGLDSSTRSFIPSDNGSSDAADCPFFRSSALLCRAVLSLRQPRSETILNTMATTCLTQISERKET